MQGIETGGLAPDGKRLIDNNDRQPTVQEARLHLNQFIKRKKGLREFYKDDTALTRAATQAAEMHLG